jgi:hypothetical protein
MTSWSHPELGQFEFDRISWNGEVSLSGSQSFGMKSLGVDVLFASYRGSC